LKFTHGEILKTRDNLEEIETELRESNERLPYLSTFERRQLELRIAHMLLKQRELKQKLETLEVKRALLDTEKTENQIALIERNIEVFKNLDKVDDYREIRYAWEAEQKKRELAAL
jgi:hypothetical protein